MPKISKTYWGIILIIVGLIFLIYSTLYFGSMSFGVGSGGSMDFVFAIGIFLQIFGLYLIYVDSRKKTEIK